jgi:hypothetical protein
VIIIVIIIIVAPAHALLTVSHHLSICSTAARAANVAEISNQSKRNPQRGLRPRCTQESSIDFNLDRDCRSNPMATILSWRCQPLVTRTIDI